VKLNAAKAHVALRLRKEAGPEVSPEAKGQKHEGAKAYWKLKADKQKKIKAGSERRVRRF
jgi:hypothetical protein